MPRCRARPALPPPRRNSSRPASRSTPTADWDTGLRHAPDIIRGVLGNVFDTKGLRKDILVNVNFPDCPPEEVRGIAVTCQGKRDQELLHIEPRYDGRGNPYYWLAFERRKRVVPANGTDLSAIADCRIAVTALRLDLTDEPFTTRLAQLFG